MRKQNYPILVALLLSSLAAASAADKAETFSRADLAAATTLRERCCRRNRLFLGGVSDNGGRPRPLSGDKAVGLREMQRLGFANVRT
jgi:hypothetical protein